MAFDNLHSLICDALRGDRPQLVIEAIDPNGRRSLYFGAGTSQP